MTDEERREVARKLRELDMSDLGDDRGIIDTPEESGALFSLMLEAANDYRPGLHYATSHFAAKDAVELFADLIDRPTCRNVSGYCDRFVCSECRCSVVESIAEHCNEHGEIFTAPFMPSYCPNCGAVVVR